MNYCIDIDDTILFSELKDGKYYLKKPNLPLIEIINELFDAGHIIVLHTGRHWNHLELTKKQLLVHNVKYTTLVMGKPVADVYIDDKGMRPEEFIDEYRK